MKRLLQLLGLILFIALVGSWIVFQFILRQRPFARAEVYFRQAEKHALTADSAGHWKHVLEALDSLSRSHQPFFPLSGTYDPGVYRAWCAQAVERGRRLDPLYPAFTRNEHYGWPAALQGRGWTLYALDPIVWAAPSIAIIEPGRSAEAADAVRRAIDILRSPAAWKDQVFDEAGGDPMVDNLLWKSSLLIAEGLYGLMTGDRETYRPEMEALARDLFQKQRDNLSRPIGQGFSGGECCRSGWWLAQCNALSALGLEFYDRLYGTDAETGTLIGEGFRRELLAFLKKEMIDPRTRLPYRAWHPTGPLQAEQATSPFAGLLAAFALRPFDDAFASDLYRRSRPHHLKSSPLAKGEFLAEAEIPDLLPGEGADCLGPGGGTGASFFVAWAATREFEDKRIFNAVNQWFTDEARPYFSGGEIRFDETNPDPSPIPGYSAGRLLNMMSGWWLLGKVHVGWKTILDHDWSQNRDPSGRMLNR
jgi:hypothetical protein